MYLILVFDTFLWIDVAIRVSSGLLVVDSSSKDCLSVIDWGYRMVIALILLLALGLSLTFVVKTVMNVM